VVDDSQDVRRLLRHYLRTTWAEVVEAANGRVACDLAFDAQNRRADFDLVLLDMEMPELDGHAAATLLRMQGFAGPIVALTANDDANQRRRSVESGCSEYLGKPVEREVLLAVVRHHLEARDGHETRPSAGAEGSLRPTELAGSGDTAGAGIEQFLQQFLATLPGYVGVLEDLLRRQAVEQLWQTVHQLKGAAGMYGFDRLYDVAASAEGAARSVARAGGDAAAAEGGRLRGEIDSLIGLIRSTCAGSPVRAKEAAV
jgi:CheY-like chemotaxis protein/HPt (histidine-containing phosphotransfer) domain-containing protein